MWPCDSHGVRFKLHEGNRQNDGGELPLQVSPVSSSCHGSIVDSDMLSEQGVERRCATDVARGLKHLIRVSLCRGLTTGTFVCVGEVPT